MKHPQIERGEEFIRQTKLLYSIIVAGKSANFTDAAVRKFIDALSTRLGDPIPTPLPFDMCHQLDTAAIQTCAMVARTGNYTKLVKAIQGVVEALLRGLDLKTCKPEDLEEIHGIGPKTSRFFIMWCRPEEEYAALDVHVLRYLKAAGVPRVPKLTPSAGKEYTRLEKLFIQMAHDRGMTPRQLDVQVWEAGAGRTQATPLPPEKPRICSACECEISNRYGVWGCGCNPPDA